MLTPRCSKCEREIPPADVHVANDVAFCRACNVAHKLSSLIHGVPLDTDLDLTRPPAGTWYRSTGLGAVIGASHRSVASAVGLLFFTVFWNGIVSVFVLLALGSTLFHLGIPIPDWFSTQMKRGDLGVGMTIFLWLFLTPFILVGLAMFIAFLSALAGRTEVQLHHSSGSVFSGIGPVGRRRRFNTAQVKDVRIDKQSWRDSDGDRRNKTHIVLQTQDGKEIKFGSMLRPERMKFVAAGVRKAIADATS